MHRRTALVAAAGVAGALAIANPLGALPPGTDGYNKNAESVTIACDNGDDSITYAAPPALWPPNHKYYKDIVVTANGDADDAIVLTTTGTHNQYEGDVEQNGTGNTGDDVRPEDGTFNSGTGEDGNVEFIATEEGPTTISETWWARAERSGHKSSIDTQGRQYDFTYNATFDGVACYSTAQPFSVIVPHDMRKSNRT